MRQHVWCAFLSLLFILSLVGCAPEPSPDLLEIDRIEPPALEHGSELRIEGLGFAERRVGTLLLRGTMFAPGRAPRAVRWSHSVVPETQTLAVLRLKELDINELLGGGPHGTFRGTAELSFDPVMDGRPTLHGQREGVVLDVFSEDEPSFKDAQQFMSFLGLGLAPSFEVESVEPQGIAATAGLSAGDRLLALDGVHLDALADFVPAPHMNVSALSYVRPESDQVLETQLRRSDFQLLDRALSSQGLAFALGLGLALVLIARPPQLLVWLTSARLRRKPSTLSWMDGVHGWAQPLSYVIFALVSVGYFLVVGDGVFSLGPFDFLLVLTSGVLCLLLGAFVLGGSSPGRRFSLLGAFASTSTAFLITLPVVVGALSRAAEVGSLRLLEIDSAQGSLPPQWGALQSPWSLMLSMGYLLALLPLAGRRPPVFAEQGMNHPSLLLGRSLEWLGSLLLLALWLSLFGGAQLDRTQGSVLLGEAVFCLKFAALAYLIGTLRARSGQLRLSEAFSLWGFKNIVQCSLGALLLVLSWSKWSSLLTFEVKSVFSLTLCGTVVLFSCVAWTRSWMHGGRRADPWI